jgi:hypothetical protein
LNEHFASFFPEIITMIAAVLRISDEIHLSIEMHFQDYDSANVVDRIEISGMQQVDKAWIDSRVKAPKACNQKLCFTERAPGVTDDETLRWNAERILKRHRLFL